MHDWQMDIFGAHPWFYCCKWLWKPGNVGHAIASWKCVRTVRFDWVFLLWSKGTYIIKLNLEILLLSLFSPSERCFSFLVYDVLKNRRSLCRISGSQIWFVNISLSLKLGVKSEFAEVGRRFKKKRNFHIFLFSFLHFRVTLLAKWRWI